MIAIVLAGWLSAREARAQNVGFQLDRYEPTPAGEFFFSVEHPWYSKTRYFAAGITLDYAHNPLVFRTSDGASAQSIVGNQLVGHVDIAGSFWDHLQLSLSLPLTLAESGGSFPTLGPDVKASGFAVGDVRVGVMFRLYGQPRTDAFSLHLGGYLWVPVQTTGDLAGDHSVRGLPKVIASGISKYIRWSASVGFLFRQAASVGTSSMSAGGNVVGNELQFGAAIGYVNPSRRLTIGPELTYGTLVSSSGNAFASKYSSLELLGGVSYLVKDVFMIGVAAGGGIQREAGTPDARVLLRLAYAPSKPLDTDGDGIIDAEDACPKVPGVRNIDPAKNGCPVLDRDGDGIPDDVDLCPDVPAGLNPDPKRPGCPAKDTDGDGVYDYEDQCPEIPAGPNPDPNRKGCPLPDRDGDGVLDADDVCPDVPQGANPDPTRRGCPAIDRDGDGVYDYEDVCPDVPAGLHPDPDPKRKGCPEGDRDKDTVPDSADACPDQPGAPNPDPKKNGCPSLVLVKNGMIVILQPVFFATDKDVILPKSFSLLEAVKNVFLAQPEIKKVEIQGHTDSKGKLAHNMDLSDRRAKSVMNWLIKNGVSADRMVARGYGPQRPVAPNTSNSGRALNRRVEFHIVDPPTDDNQPNGTANPDVIPPSPPVDPTVAPARGHHGKPVKAKAAKGARKKKK